MSVSKVLLKHASRYLTPIVLVFLKHQIRSESQTKLYSKCQGKKCLFNDIVEHCLIRLVISLHIGFVNQGYKIVGGSIDLRSIPVCGLQWVFFFVFCFLLVFFLVVGGLFACLFVCVGYVYGFWGFFLLAFFLHQT